MNAKITTLLTALYGDPAAATLRADLIPLLDAARAAAGAAPAAELSERAALLITYADQLREPGAAPAATLAEFAKARLPGLVSGIHLLPFFPWSSDDGFAVKDFFGVDSVMGTWADIERFRPEFDLMFDAVFNHMSAQADWFHKFCADAPDFRDFFVTVTGNPDLTQVVRPRALPLLTEFSTVRGVEKVWTTFSADQVDLNFKNPRVLLATLRALLFYVARGARFIRLDAIAYLWKEIGTPCIHLPQTHQVIQLLRAVLDEVTPGVRLITETNVPHRDNISYFGDGTNEAQLVYNFALPPLVLHSLATGNAETLSRWAAALEFPSPQTTYFNFLASHDGIGMNPARGILSPTEIDALVARAVEHGGFVSYKHNSDGSKSPYELNITYFDALSNPVANEPLELQIQRFLVAHAIMFALAGVPGIYFHSLFGSRNDRAGAEASGIPRRINRQKLTRTTLEAELAQPDTLRAQVFAGLGHLLRQRRSHRAFAPAAAQRVLSLDPRVFALVREPRGGRERLLCLHNVSHETVRLSAGREVSAAVQLAPYEVRWETLPA
jgi:sucrose phosphorylase